MGLDGCCDCDGSCSGMSVVGARFVSHEEVERDFEKTMKRLDRTIRCEERRMSLQENHSYVYGVLRAVGFY